MQFLDAKIFSEMFSVFKLVFCLLKLVLNSNTLMVNLIKVGKI